MKKGVLYLAITSLLLLSTIGCKGKEEKASGNSSVGFDNSKPLTISVFTIQQKQQPPADNKIYKWIKEKYNVDFTWDILVGDKDQKIGVLIASGDYPDLVEVDSTKFQDAGALIPLEELIEKYGPNIKKHYASCWKKITEDDGHIYCLPNWGVIDGRDQSTYYGDSALWIQKDVLKEFGYPKVTTIDEYFDIIEKYMKKYPTTDGMPTIPFTILTYDWHDFCLINPPNFCAGYPNDGNGTVDMVNGKLTYRDFLNQDISKKWFKKLCEMNAKGLIDKSCFVDNYDQYIAKLSSGRVLGMHDQRWQFNDAMNALDVSGKYNKTMAPLPIVFDNSITPRYRNKPLPNIRRGFGITTKCKDPIKVIQFINAQLDEETQRVFHWGIEGEDWQYNENHEPYRTEKQRMDQKDATWILRNKADLWYSTAPKMEGSFSDGYACDMNYIPSEYLASQKPEDVELWKAYGVSSDAELMDKNPPDNSTWFPMWQETPPDGSEAQLALNKCQQAYRKYLPKIIMGKPADFEANWSEYMKALDDANINKYNEFMQSKLDARLVKYGTK
ncbi:MAG: extracellular solute-binding protein [Treponema sp.]